MRPSPPHLTHVTTMVWLVMVNWQHRVDASHTQIVLSLLALTKRWQGNALCAGSHDCMQAQGKRPNQSAWHSSYAGNIQVHTIIKCIL